MCEGICALTCGHDDVNNGKGVISYQAPPCPVLTLSRQTVALTGHTAAQERPAVVSVESRSTFLERKKNRNMKKNKLFPFYFLLFVYVFVGVYFSSSCYFWFLRCTAMKKQKRIQKNNEKIFDLLFVVVCSSLCFFLSSFSFLKHCLLFLCICWQIPL